MSNRRIVSVSAQIYDLPLPVPIKLGHFEVRSREYVAVQIETDSGHVGTSWALSRGAPIDKFVERYASDLLIGQDPTAISLLWMKIYRSMTPVVRDGSGMRALSLVDIALWDIKGQVAGIPIWALLGGYRSETDVLMVAGYLRNGEDPAQVADEVVRFSNKGHRLVKIACAASDNDTRLMLAESVSRGLNGETSLVVDAAWRWDSARSARNAAKEWHSTAPIAWLEDPFPVSRREQFELLHRSVSGLNVGAGDEASDRDNLMTLVESGYLDVLRLDLTTVGGFTGALPLILAAQNLGVTVSPHLYPETSIHLAMSFPSVDHVETFDRSIPEGNPLDPIHLYVDSELPPTGSTFLAPRRAGLSSHLDLDALSRYRI